MIFLLETIDVNNEFLNDTESDMKESNSDSKDGDSEDENVAEMDDEALVVAPKDFLYERNQFLTNLIIIVHIFFF